MQGLLLCHYQKVNTDDIRRYSFSWVRVPANLNVKEMVYVFSKASSIT